jgi:transposase
MRGRTCSRECKLEVCRQVASGEKRVAQVCREHQLRETVLLRWRNEYAARGEAAFTPKALDGPTGLEQRVAELERLCGQLALENAVLKRGLRSTPSTDCHILRALAAGRPMPDPAPKLLAS